MGAFVGVFEHMAEQMEQLQLMFAKSDENRSEVDSRLGNLADAVERLTDRIDTSGGSTDSLARIADGQDRLIAAVEGQGGQDSGIDAKSRMRLRSIDVQMLRILEEISAGRQESVSELRADLSALTAAIKGEREGVRRLRLKTPPKPGQGS